MVILVLSLLISIYDIEINYPNTINLPLTTPLVAKIFSFSLKTLSLVEDSVVNGGGVSAPLLNESCFEREKENISATSGVVKGRLIVLG